jgi:outer membrane protein assembly factor BamD
MDRIKLGSTFMTRFKRPAFLLIVSILVLNACGKREDPILLLSSEEALEMGRQLLEQEKYFKASRHLTHAFEVEPNSRSGREALLLAADALYLQGGSDNYIKCEAKYRDFLNRFPTSDRSDYAQYKIAACLAARAERPDRDQKITRQAIAAFEELLRLYPDSPNLDEARQQIRDLTNRLAAHELAIGDFYNRYAKGGICQAAIARLETVQRDYPDFREMDTVLYNLGMAYYRCEQTADGDAAFEDLKRRYPDSEWLGEADKWQRSWRKTAAKHKAKKPAEEEVLSEGTTADRLPSSGNQP